MEWLRRMLGSHRAERTAPQPSQEVLEARQRLRSELSRADRAIQQAMAHADEVFGPRRGYRGPERRARPR